MVSTVSAPHIHSPTDDTEPESRWHTTQTVGHCHGEVTSKLQPISFINFGRNLQLYPKEGMLGPVGKFLYSTETREMDKNCLVVFFHKIGMRNCVIATPQQTYLFLLQEESQHIPPKLRLQSSLAYETSYMAYVKMCEVTRLCWESLSLAKSIWAWAFCLRKYFYKSIQISYFFFSQKTFFCV